MRESRDDLQLEGGVIAEVREFCYIGDLLDSEGGVGRAGRMSVSAACNKWRDVSSLHTEKSMLLKTEPKSTMRVLDLCCCVALKAGQRKKELRVP